MRRVSLPSKRLQALMHVDPCVFHVKPEKVLVVRVWGRRWRKDMLSSTSRPSDLGVSVIWCKGLGVLGGFGGFWGVLGGFGGFWGVLGGLGFGVQGLGLEFWSLNPKPRSWNLFQCPNDLPGLRDAGDAWLEGIDLQFHCLGLSYWFMIGHKGIYQRDSGDSGEDNGNCYISVGVIVGNKGISYRGIILGLYSFIPYWEPVRNMG